MILGKKLKINEMIESGGKFKIVGRDLKIRLSRHDQNVSRGVTCINIFSNK